MATARELLEQADALMRRNRARGEAPPGGPVAAPIVAPEAAASQAPSAAADEFDDFPLLTDVVAGVDPISELGPVEAGELSRWPVEPPREAFILAEEPARASDGDGEEPPPLGVDLAEDAAVAAIDETARREALAEEVRMQVLQRLDIFTDTGLQEQLTARLQPIVDRASADLVAAINQHLGALLRAYVAEAIEREIEKLPRGDA
jgi:hypothetical protein